MTFKTKVVFYPDRDTPIEVTREIDDQLVPDFEVGNDSYIDWHSEHYGDDYPAINKYLLANGIVSCLIRISW